MAPARPGLAALAVHRGGVVERQRTLRNRGDVVERHLDRVVGPQALGTPPASRPPAGRYVVVEHRHQRAALTYQAGPVPGHAAGPWLGYRPMRT